MNTIFQNLSKAELQLLAIYTLFHAEGTEATKVKSALIKLLDKPSLPDFKKYQESLRSKGFLTTNGYNWRTDTYDFILADERLIECMLYFYQEQPDLTINTLKTVKGLHPADVQKILWNFISSDFKNIDLEELDDYEIGADLDIFQPVLTDNRFAPLVLLFNPENFYDLFDQTIASYFEDETLTDVDYLRSLFNSYQGGDYQNMHERIVCLIDLYDYMAFGRTPETLLAENKNHRIIAALHEAYHGNNDKALTHLKKAVTLNNKSTGRYSTNKSYLHFSIVNFFYVLICYRTGTEEGRKKALTISKANENYVTEAGKALHSIIFNSGTDKQKKKNVSALFSSSSRIDKVLATLLSYYIGESHNRGTKPQWLILKQEMQKYFPMTDNEKLFANKVYGENGMLATIYHKQEWEFVLEELMDKSASAGVSQERDVRIGYFMHSINSFRVEIRQQSILKNGAWSAGKQVSVQGFLNGNVEGMSLADHRIAAEARKETYYSYDFSLEYVLPEMVEQSRLYVGVYAPYTLVDVTEEMPYLTLTQTKSGFQVTSNVPLSHIEDKVIITHTGAASINFIRLTDAQRPYYRRLLQLGAFPLEAEEQLRMFLKQIGGKLEVNSDLVEGGSTLPVIDGTSQLIMQMRPQDRDTYVVGLFCRPLENGRIRCTPGDGNEIIVDGVGADRTRVKRDLAKERENLDHIIDATEIADLMEYGSADTSSTGGAFAVPAFDLLPLIEYAQQNPDRISCEWPEGAQMKVHQRKTTTSWNGAIKKNENGWFEIEGSVELDQGKVVTMAQLLDLVNQSHGRFIKLGEGDYLALSDKLRKQLTQLDAIASRSHGRLQMSPFSAALLGADILEGELFLEEDEELKQIRQRIKDSSKYSPRVPKDLNATLREYQKEGYKWMARLNKWGAGALLADDMGLGKTIQTISFLLLKAKEGPALVIAPASVAPNWKVEFEKFAPSLNVQMLNFAADRSATIKNAKANDVVVMTYGLLLSVKDDVTKKHWKTICLDEAHIIKNRGAKTSAVAMKLKSDNRVMLTGTPVQNHLGELWNLFQFVNPGLLGSFEDFSRRFIQPIEQLGDKDRQHELDRLVKPFMLRRTKDKVAKELPDKEEIYQHVNLTEEEQLIYEAMRQKAEALLMAEQGNTVSMNTLAEITKLRQCACDIRLIDKGKTTTVPVVGEPVESTPSADGSKIKALIELLSTISESDSHALVFSQFTSYLALVKKALDKEGIHYLYIDGAVPIKERTKLVEQFQQGVAPVFLISLKAGGLGLNLTRANYVIHMDPWWNPAIEAQATDRAHRIGQKQAVTVYHLIAEGTIEEKIQRLHERKQTLVNDILESTDMSHKLTGEELLEMVSAG